MTEHSRQTSPAEKVQAVSVADYIVQRIADEGVTHKRLFLDGVANGSNNTKPWLTLQNCLRWTS